MTPLPLKLFFESLAIACELGALKLKDLRAVAVDTTVQEKNIAHPTEHSLLRKAVDKLGDLARRSGIKLRQSYTRVVQKASIKVGLYIHAKQMRRARKELKFIRVRLGRLIRDIERKVKKIIPLSSQRLPQYPQRPEHLFDDPPPLASEFQWPNLAHP